MIFSEYDIQEQIFSVGEGIVKIDGIGCMNIKFPKISEKTDLNKQILDGLAYQEGLEDAP